MLLLDTASLYFRAFFGVPDSLKAPDGTPVNAVRGLLDFIARLTADYEPTHLVCCWDNNWRPSWRVDLLPSYKAHRVVREEGGVDVEETPEGLTDRKSTRLNSSHVAISYAVFCLKKKKANIT